MSYLVSTLRTSADDGSLPMLRDPVSFPTLNFLLTIATSRLKIVAPYSLSLHRMGRRLIGSGGFSDIDVATTKAEGKLVAVKHNRALVQRIPQNVESHFDHHFVQLALELRILCHGSLAKHPNIVDIFGLCVADGLERPVLSLLLEFSPYGSLRKFLTNSETEVSTSGCCNFAVQVACGLEALHDLKICHGDVKLENTLVFPESDHWRIKLSDFGLSVIPCRGDPSGRSGFPFGTPLYNAPEIRKGLKSDDSDFTIDDAILTDVFSFGLLTLEIAHYGHCFAQKISVIDHSGNLRKDQVKADHLDELTHDTLLRLALDSLDNIFHDSSLQGRLQAALTGSLRDTPAHRSSVRDLRKILDVNEPFVWNDPWPAGLVEWTKVKSLFEVISNGTDLSEYSLQNLPEIIIRWCVSELELMYNSMDLPSETRQCTAMILSESYAVGFAGCRDKTKIIEWLAKAAMLKNEKARKWYFRVCSAFGTPTQHAELDSNESFENDLLTLHSTRYLISRIRLFNVHVLRDASQKYRSCLQESSQFWTSRSFSVTNFNESMIDTLSPLHVASWVGNDSHVRQLLEIMPIDGTSTQGFTPLHYACYGGNISTMKLLLSRSASQTPALLGITPLHLCMHFDEADLQEAVMKLLSHGASQCQETEPIIWEDHDICLSGTPLDWAILTRNRSLVEILSSDKSCQQSSDSLQKAVSHFFWDIADILFHQKLQNNALPAPRVSFDAINRPFSHWIAHGPDHAKAVSKTLSFCLEHRIYPNDPEEYLNSLMSLIRVAKVQDDFKVIELSLSNVTDSQFTEVNNILFKVLLLVIGRSKNDAGWTLTLQLLVSRFSIGELEAKDVNEYTVLHAAIIVDALVATKILLEKGFNVNQPSFNEFAQTPLDLWFNRGRSLSMYQLLKSKGAKTSPMGFGRESATSQMFNSGISFTTPFQDTILQHINAEHPPAEAMYRMFKYTMSSTGREAGVGVGAGVPAMFAHVLAQAAVRNLIDSPVFHGATMLHVAALSLNFKIVALLLEAGANAEVVVSSGTCRITPLQMACLNGYLAWRSDLSKSIQKSNQPRRNEIKAEGEDGVFGMQRIERRASAMRVGTFLLQWHHTNGGRLFQGITALHLASYMGIESEIEKLRRLYEAAEPRGRWPSLDNEVTPSELRDADVLQDLRGAHELLTNLNDDFPF